ncbi:hypothetical protein CAEBREN_15517 [Caenorhabditis brenneri]|uniref:Uncharacterized protein n=1 Tax=Caenorhabditis brenneri TaxID=135651 RepID=G0MHE8_CAEBE|nr:hypothetical protein CAEBREN_15517 [Caenorhabditis brenneri]
MWLWGRASQSAINSRWSSPHCVSLGGQTDGKADLISAYP